MTAFLQLALAHPNWFDLLKFSGGGQLGEMERVAPYLDEAVFIDTDIHESRDIVARALHLASAQSPIPALYQAVANLGSGVTVLSLDDGSKCDGLFGSFVVENNPMWCNV
ncbi:MAG: hypothetical protein LBF93_07165 [Zoogloeaceae bacterium]|nr:hypothetical protein [Zoogloeaceae bacterium]